MSANQYTQTDHTQPATLHADLTGTWGACPMLDPEFDLDDYEVAMDLAYLDDGALVWTR